jgi:hypothetical protein
MSEPTNPYSSPIVSEVQALGPASEPTPSQDGYQSLIHITNITVLILGAAILVSLTAIINAARAWWLLRGSLQGKLPSDATWESIEWWDSTLFQLNVVVALAISLLLLLAIP